MLYNMDYILYIIYYIILNYFQASGSCADPFFILVQLIVVPHGPHATETASRRGPGVLVSPRFLRHFQYLTSPKGFVASLWIFLASGGQGQSVDWALMRAPGPTLIYLKQRTDATYTHIYSHIYICIYIYTYTYIYIYV